MSGNSYFYVKLVNTPWAESDITLSSLPLRVIIIVIIVIIIEHIFCLFWSHFLFVFWQCMLALSLQSCWAIPFIDTVSRVVCALIYATFGDTHQSQDCICIKIGLPNLQHFKISPCGQTTDLGPVHTETLFSVNTCFALLSSIVHMDPENPQRLKMHFIETWFQGGKIRKCSPFHIDDAIGPPLDL